MNVSIFEIERRMNLGGWYTNPMLLKGDSLNRTIDDDASVLNTLNLTANFIGEKMFLLIYQAKGTDWFKPITTDTHTVEIHHRRGLITCPWALNEYESCNFNNWMATSDEFKISNTINGTTVTGLVLSIHMIKEHCFFGGGGTKSRLEPHMLADLLNTNKD